MAVSDSKRMALDGRQAIVNHYDFFVIFKYSHC